MIASQFIMHALINIPKSKVCVEHGHKSALGMTTTDPGEFLNILRLLSEEM